MRERIAPDDRLVGLHDVAGQARHEARRACELPRGDGRVQARDVTARGQQHHDLLERRVARALADAVDRALDLPRPRERARVGVGDRQAEVVVAVRRDDDVLQARDQAVQAGEVGHVLVGCRVADRVGDVDRRRPLLDRGGTDLGRVLELRARGVHRRELDVLDERAGVRDGRARLRQHVLAGRAELVHDVDVRRRDERVDPRSLGVAYGSGSSLHIGRLSPRESSDDRAVHLARDRRDGLEVAGRGDREAGLDDVDVQAGELVGDLELLGGVQRDAGRLLAVAQGRVEDPDVAGVRLHAAHDVSCSLAERFEVCCFSVGLRQCGRHADGSPYRGSRRSRDSSNACVMRIGV